jgi:tetratricopeptide (TPR) repeat protein
MAKRSKADLDEIALDQAQELIFDAFDAKSRREERALILKALLLSPNCSDAYTLLSQQSKDGLEALALLLAAVAAGERALGAKAFKEMHGSFWGFLETRPYMRALVELGLSYDDLKEFNRAIECFKKALDLNPNDNQGVRDLLMPLLILCGEDEEAEKLYLAYKNDRCASWLYSRALLDYRNPEKAQVAEKDLLAAVEKNKHVADFLTGRKKFLFHNPDYYSYGSIEEAELYMHHNLRVWEKTPGALAWIKSILPKQGKGAG